MLLVGVILPDSKAFVRHQCYEKPVHAPAVSIIEGKDHTSHDFPLQFILKHLVSTKIHASEIVKGRCSFFCLPFSS